MRFWPWHKGRAVDSKLPEKCTSVCVAPNGVYLFGGGKSGKLYVWELSTGSLLHTWSGHYKSVTVLKSDATGTLLISGGDDAVLHLWLVPEILDPHPSKPAQALHSWSGHTLPITDVEVLSGGAATRVVSVSLDCSCQLWTVASQDKIASYQLPSPLLAVIAERGERLLYCGAQNGHIYEVALDLHPGSENTHLTFSHHHDQSVVSLAITPLTEQLVSGSLDGTVRVWDRASKQCLQCLDVPGKKPISNVFVVYDPQKTLTDESASEQLPILGISKYPGTRLREPHYPWEGPLIAPSQGIDYSGISHIFLNPEVSCSIPVSGEVRHGPEKILLDGESAQSGQDVIMEGAIHPSNLKSLVGQILSEDTV